MKKRVLSFLLCLLMVLPLLLVSCGSDQGPEDTEEGKLKKKISTM